MSVAIEELSRDEIDHKIGLLTHDLKRFLNHMFHIPEGYSSGLTELFVDNIIAVSVLTVKREMEREQTQQRIN